VANDARIQVTGLRDLQKGLRQIDRDLPKELRKGLNEVAEVVITAARPLVPRRTGRAQESMKVRSTQRAAQIAVGGTVAPYFPWLDFGGRVGRAKAVRRPFLKEGRYIYPTLKAKRPELNEKIDEMLRRLAEQAGFDTTGDAARG
jgi:bacteriophage HK97-gp10 putative tail-component